MRKWIAIFLVLLAPSLWSARNPLPNEWWGILHPEYPTVKILIEQQAEEITIETIGPYRVFNPANCTIVSSGFWGKKFPALALYEGVKWGEEYLGTYQIAIVPSPGSSVMVDGVSYPGSIYVYAVDGKINVVNQLNTEEFLRDTLSTQTQSPMHDEALAALAITARTAAYYQAARYKDAFYHYEASAVGYTGLNCMYKKGVEQAVAATRNLVLRQSGVASASGLFAATWTEHCAGRTAAPQLIVRKDVNYSGSGVESALAMSDRPAVGWSLLMKKTEFAKALGVSDVTGVTAFQDGASGKIYGVRCNSASGNREFDLPTLQRLVGKEKLVSSDFTVNVDGDVVVFNGFGKGLGTGLCLWTANTMAQHGLDAVKILRKFYPAVQVQTMDVLPGGG